MPLQVTPARTASSLPLQVTPARTASSFPRLFSIFFSPLVFVSFPLVFVCIAPSRAWSPSPWFGGLVSSSCALALVSCILRTGSSSSLLIVTYRYSSLLFCLVYRQNWVWALLLSYFLFLGPFFIVGTFLNFVAVGYNSSTALPFGYVPCIQSSRASPIWANFLSGLV